MTSTHHIAFRKNGKRFITTRLSEDAVHKAWLASEGFDVELDPAEVDVLVAETIAATIDMGLDPDEVVPAEHNDEVSVYLYDNELTVLPVSYAIAHDARVRWFEMVAEISEPNGSLDGLFTDGTEFLSRAFNSPDRRERDLMAYYSWEAEMFHDDAVNGGATVDEFFKRLDDLKSWSTLSSEYWDGLYQHYVEWYQRIIGNTIPDIITENSPNGVFGGTREFYDEMTNLRRGSSRLGEEFWTAHWEHILSGYVAYTEEVEQNFKGVDDDDEGKLTQMFAAHNRLSKWRALEKLFKGEDEEDTDDDSE